MPPPSRHWTLRYGLPIGGLLVLVGAYLGLMALTIDVSRLSHSRTAEDRDQVYTVIHLAILFFAGVGGFAIGKWVNGLGVAFATLFLLVLSTTMLGAQIGSYAAACHAGQNDIIRHWNC